MLIQAKIQPRKIKMNINIDPAAYSIQPHTQKCNPELVIGLCLISSNTFNQDIEAFRSTIGIKQLEPYSPTFLTKQLFSLIGQLPEGIFREIDTTVNSLLNKFNLNQEWREPLRCCLFTNTLPIPKDPGLHVFAGKNQEHPSFTAQITQFPSFYFTKALSETQTIKEIKRNWPQMIENLKTLPDKNTYKVHVRTALLGWLSQIYAKDGITSPTEMRKRYEKLIENQQYIDEWLDTPSADDFKKATKRWSQFVKTVSAKNTT